jgi:hypothetical protein
MFVQLQVVVAHNFVFQDQIVSLVQIIALHSFLILCTYNQLMETVGVETGNERVGE